MKKKITTCIKNRYRYILFIAVLVLLLTVDLKSVLMKYSMMNTLKDNLQFIEDFLTRYTSVLVITIIIIAFLFWKKKVVMKVSKLTVAGAEISIRNSEKTIKANIKNFLSTKRTLFKINKKYDNYYDVINSFHEVYGYLREQILLFEETNEETGACYQNLENSLVALNEFLTKYQSDYRRWYVIKTKDEKFLPFFEIQKTYDKYEDMNMDLEKLNETMKSVASYFEINIEKWKDF